MEEPRPRRRPSPLLAALLVAGCGGLTGAPEVTIDIPDDLVGAFQRGAPIDEYVFYALADRVPDWDSVAQAGIFICSEDRPPLIPEQARGAIDSGGFQPGTVLTLSGDTEGIENVLGIGRLVVTIPPAVEGCVDLALDDMMDTPGMLLMTNAGASFQGKDKLVEIVFE